MPSIDHIQRPPPPAERPRPPQVSLSRDLPRESSAPSLESPKSRPPAEPQPPVEKSTPPNSARAAPPPPQRKPAPARVVKAAIVEAVDTPIWMQSSGPEDERTMMKKELVAAEHSYVQVCTTALNSYLQHNSGISKRDKESLFANLDQIIAVHRQALQQITENSLASDMLKTLAPHLHLYLPYIANIPQAFLTLSRLRESGNFVDVILEDSFDVPTIEALFEFPKQHLEDYTTMIKNFIERTNASTDPQEVAQLNQALQDFSVIHQQVKSRDTVPKHLTRLWDIEHSFIPEENMTLNSRELFHEGSSRLVRDSKEQVASGNESVFVYILKGLVICAIPVNGYSSRSLIKTPPENLLVRDVSDNECKNGLEFISNGRSLLLSVPTSALKRKWMTDLPIQYDGGKPLTSRLVL